MSYLALVIARPQRKPTFLNMFKHGKMIRTESNEVFERKLRIKILKWHCKYKFVSLNSVLK